MPKGGGGWWHNNRLILSKEEKGTTFEILSLSSLHVCDDFEHVGPSWNGFAKAFIYLTIIPFMSDTGGGLTHLP